jgi:uncharacterized protein
MPSNLQNLTCIVERFVSTENVQGAAIVTPQGLLFASNLPDSLSEQRIMEMSRALLTLGQQVGSDLSQGLVEQLYLQSDDNCLILTSCAENAVLFVIAHKTATQGALMLEISRLVAKIGSLVQAGSRMAA